MTRRETGEVKGLERHIRDLGLCPEESRMTMKMSKQEMDPITSAFLEMACYDLLQGP